MIVDNFCAFCLLYVRPVTAISRILDKGRLWFAILVAVAVALLLLAGQTHSQAQASLKADNSSQAAMAVQPGANGDGTPSPGADGQIFVIGGSPLSAVFEGARTWMMLPPARVVSPLGALVLAFVPLLIGLRAISGFGSFSVLMRSDYIALLMCTLLSWSAAFLPVAVADFFIAYQPMFAFLLGVASQLYFLLLIALSIRTFWGTHALSALGVGVIAWMGAVLGLALSDVAGPLRYYLTSPFLLYYGYSLFRSDFSALGDGLRSRQHLRNQLEVATNNPRDADAHYQLGLLYQKRRQYSEALARFQKAVEIDPNEGDAHLQLGRIALEQNRVQDAIGHLEKSVRIDDKLSSSEGLRDLGAAYLRAKRLGEASEALHKYAERRPYDPEGLYWFGKSLAALGNPKQARERFEECVQAVETSPKHRRAHIRKWASEAQSELKALAS